MTVVLPSGFETLQPFVAKWALSTENERCMERRRSSAAEIKSFYDAILPLLPGILDRVDEYPVGKVNGADSHLFYMAMSLAEIAPHVEFYKGSPFVPFAFQEDRMIGTHSHIADS